MSALADAPVGGRWFGVLHHRRLNQEQLVALDLIPVRQPKNCHSYLAIMTLYFGDFSSREYVSFRFDSVEYHSGKKMLFGQSDQDLALEAAEFSRPWDELHANVRSVAGKGIVGTVRLRREKVVQTNLPLLQPLWGEYQGLCGTVKNWLQLKVVRSSDETTLVGNPFLYTIKGMWARHEPRMAVICKNVGNRPCVQDNFTGAYNFFTGKLTLLGVRTRQCTVGLDRITCGDCQFEKTPPPNEGKFSPVESSANFGNLARSDGASAFEGDYTGYGHHSFLNRYQHMSLQILSTGSPGSLSTTAQIFFGDQNSGEAIPYSFDPVAFDPAKPFPLVFRRAGSGADAVLEVLEIDNGILKGRWHSLVYGYVGEFLLSRKGAFALPAGSPIMEPVNGIYEWRQLTPRRVLHYDLYVTVVLGHTKPNTFNPFFPLSFASYYLNRERVVPRTGFTGGTFDFYTGRISLGDLFMGERADRENMRLALSASTLATPLPYGDPERVDYRGPIQD